MENQKIAIIGGTGVYDHTLLKEAEELVIETRYGQSLVRRSSYPGRTVYFMARHGISHGVPPHLINYRANIAALKQLGVTAVIATAAVGSLRRSIPPGSRVAIDQFLDFTGGRQSTFFDGESGMVVHTDFTEPYCPEIRAAILRAAKKVGQNVINGGCYVCTGGPRFETPAEINMFSILGGDVVGMTNVPEVVLAREAGLCYATIALVSNFAAGISPDILTHEEVLAFMAGERGNLDRLLAACIDEIDDVRSCKCRQMNRYWEKIGGAER